ncbi:MAG: ATP-dependent DNA helicase RecG [Candidatus Woesebacteria bacterium GW2011_GWA1_33_30]|uniref:Probable DNA 3'-5' helicase RecG n=1 Tax=Candidatus Woesebacteria bacterium GW2011_GWA2_33_28 TaxID=1618561 RepID=A0A0G0CA54_9BACT|nr:MAG: ATP-dependent DNA helicase RecG [Candidatus Woesebacteria bacterium GW2011_GWA2_33_28]KKP48888.1 MAG: ATP-dependent DNA helicase RecG [Candidatus Woesebacteria bacterium GW2011_GWA1_33_30]KKP50161.1 MAG: ATP-dependent DNA helicase RecG [Microgenomates group bacterium GW2011_GWC1_33_32]KKP51931.1 MAG: ATP-dependent DNA helicase RecG [Candidatus Woesebacteria bacterium GW2011_GWB1_33_38]
MNLTDSVSTLPFVGPSFEKKLKRLEIITISDLLHHIPNRYLDFSKFTKIKDIKPDELISVFGEITSIKNQPTKSGKLMQMGTLEDDTGRINIIWFNQFYLARMLIPGTKVIISGKASWFNRKIAFFSPQYEKMDYEHESVHTGKIIGVYPQTAGLTNKWLKARIKYALDRIEIFEFLKDKHGLLDFDDAIHKIHFPRDSEEAEEAKKRLAFNEFYNLLISAKERKNKLLKKKSIKLEIDNKPVNEFIESLPFKLTSSQKKVVTEIFKELRKDTPMNRLLQGDVGSGKTVVAVIASFVTFLNGYQTILLAPTQILANQHYETYKKLFEKLTIRIALITGSSVKKELGKTDIYIGTHALINKIKEFTNVGLAIIDEQHKFGVKQIDFLKNKNPNRLTMTATPIPRTIAQTLFSDMDLSILDEIPENRPKIKTWLVPNEKREKAYEWISEQMIQHGSQCFIICPLVEESDTETLKNVRSVKKEFGSLKLKFKSLKLGLLHGKLKEKEKNQILSDFKNQKIDILVSTPVVEVGIDVPNATIMLIEGADRFGLAQLHQLRGRVGRGDKESYCLLFTENESGKAIHRLTTLTKTSSGFELAELDFKLRGAGDVLGIKQSGFGNLKIADWSDTKLIKLATEAVNNV